MYVKDSKGETSKSTRWLDPTSLRSPSFAVRECQKLKIVCNTGTQPVIPPVYGVIVLP
jgi:hypothetical protein